MWGVERESDRFGNYSERRLWRPAAEIDCRNLRHLRCRSDLPARYDLALTRRALGAAL